MNHGSFELTILVDNKPIPEYYHKGDIFIEGRADSEYKIRVHNKSYTSACFIVSVDGLSVLDGKEASEKSPGYIVAGHGTLDIACYKVDEATGAKFVFGSKDKSYSAQIGKGTDNVGVIAARVFKENPKPVQHVNSIPRGRGIGSVKAMGIAPSGAGEWIASNSAGGETSLKSTPGDDRIRADDMDETKLGTQFGESMEWKTRTVAFDRQDTPACSLILYYDTRKNLERRGVKLDHQAPTLPNPFPGDKQGCEPPAGWSHLD